MNVLVTGGAGFIGSNFIYYYLKNHQTHSLVCIDSMTYAANPLTLDEAKKNSHFTFIHADITNREEIFEIFRRERFDVIVNFAAESHVDRSIEDPSIFLKTNVLGTQNLMDAARETQVSRFHQVSTDEVYGDLPLDRPDLLFTEKSPMHASSPYAASKAAADLLALSYYRTYRFPVTLSRCSNNYGPYQHVEKLIPLMIVKALSQQPLPVYGTGKNIRDWLHVEDHCSALDTILFKGTPGEVYNIGGNNERTNLEVVKSILRQLNKPESLIEFVPDRPGHDLRYAIDAGKMKRDLGWEPNTPFVQGIQDTVRWYLNNTSWWETILPFEPAKPTA
jgi:dTDP-glucose 4,6-dehydratase